LSFLRCIPNMVVAAPSDENECRQLLTTAFRYEGPAAVRYPRGTGTGAKIDTELTTLPIGKGEIRLHGSRVAILAFGSPLADALSVGAEIGATVANMRFVKPLDESLVLELARTHAAIVTVEDNAINGGAGSSVVEFLESKNLQIPVLQLGLPDRFLEHASREQLLAEAGIDASGIRVAITKRWPQFSADRLPEVRSAV
jgi:1-deoxy-D-xylulose-5-phosphate synthase